MASIDTALSFGPNVGLLEPRYFIQPFLFGMIIALDRQPPGTVSSLCAVLLTALQNLALLYVFLERPFARSADVHMPTDTSPGRFMF